MIRCKDCRSCLLDLGSVIIPADENKATLCTVYHVNIDRMPQWMRSAIQEVQWTRGRCACPDCERDIGGFDFQQPERCLCGMYITIYLEKNLADLDHVPTGRPRIPEAQSTIQPAEGPSATVTSQPNHTNARPELNYNCTETLRSTQTIIFHPPPYQAARRRLRMNEDSDASDSSTSDSESSFGPYASSDSSGFPPDSDNEFWISSATGGRTVAYVVQREAISNDHEDAVAHEPHNELSNSSSGTESDTEGTVNPAGGAKFGFYSEDDDMETLTCAICLDIFFSPYTCAPCGHTFCEPCLRTLAHCNTSRTPCPLCRTVIVETRFDRELHCTIKAFYPRNYETRRRSFRRSHCIRWPLPHNRRDARILWEIRRYPARAVADCPPANRNAFLGARRFEAIFWLFDTCLLVGFTYTCNWFLGFMLFSLIFLYLL